jgi:hypothetical protein
MARARNDRLMNIQLVGNLWGYLIYWVAGDLIDLLTYAPHVNTGMRQYMFSNIDSPILAVFMIVGTFLDLRLFMIVAFIMLISVPGKVGASIFLRIMRILDRMPLIP